MSVLSNGAELLGAMQMGRLLIADEKRDVDAAMRE